MSTNTEASTLVKDLIEAGIHFGQRNSAWNPKMGRYIYGKRGGIHIIDIKETVTGLLLAKKFVSRTVAICKDICFIGTKRQAKAVLEERAGDAGMPYVTERWLGGTLTNFRTIRERLKRLEELEGLEESGAINSYSKKMEATLHREKAKILRNLEGVRHMDKLPGAMVIIDVKREMNALREARKLGIPTVCLIDTDSDPDFADIAIPGNDDAMRAIEVIVDALCKAVQEGKSQRQAVVGKDQAEAGGEGGQSQRRRSSRAMFRAKTDTSAEAGDAGETAEAPAAAEPAPEPAAKEG